MATQPNAPPTPGLDREEPEIATEDDIPTPSNDDPEKGRVPEDDGTPEHPRT